ncbi:MAG: preprotein translocase subunit SecA [Vampirovibrionales bacterium]|nr:preprotein translocase subunit SecA [Vampirovibrionales bacterium]
MLTCFLLCIGKYTVFDAYADLDKFDLKAVSPMLDLLRKVIPDPNVRKVRAMQPTVDHINDLEAEMQKLSDEELRAKTEEFRQILANRERADNHKQDRQWEKQILDNLLPEAFAVVREASRRVLNMRHFDVQLIGGMVLHNGGIAEMRTGEGKTLVATLPAYLNALTGKGVHVVTVNDYLARRDAEWMGQIYKFLGLSVGMVLSEQRGFDSFSVKKDAYASDITYGTNNEFGFDYLRDNMAGSKSQLCQRAFNFAIIDEVDSILIDEARTPLIISGRLEQSADMYRTMARVAPSLSKDDDYTVDEKGRNVVMTEEGIDHAQELLNVEDLFDIQNNWAHYVLQALKAKELFRRDIDYVVNNGEVVIVDEFTGRLMEGRRWSDGLHQSVEAKEGLQIQDETQTLASITFQNLFRLYPKLSGMTGTAMTEEAEFGKIYNLSVTTIPTNREDIRVNMPDTIFKNEKVKYIKAVEEIVEYHELGRPVLVGTVSIEKSEELSKMLSTPVYMTQHLREKARRTLDALENGKETELIRVLGSYLKNPERYQKADFDKLAEQYKDKGELPDLLHGLGETAHAVSAIQKGIPHHVLNAKHHEHEAHIVAQAGRYKAVTIATNMAGRGTDILLGGNPEFLVKKELLEEGRSSQEIDEPVLTRLVDAKKVITEDEKKKVIELGGLHIIGTERHESRRIDNQLRGRAARQGDPGSTHFFLSLEDSLMRKFGGDKIAGMMDMLGVEETMPISHGMVSRAIEGAQRKVEAYFFDIRKNILQYDDVLTEQRQLIYEQRKKVLNGENLRSSIRHMIEQVMERLVYLHVPPNSTSEDWDEDTRQALINEVNGVTHRFSHLDQSLLEQTSVQKLIDTLQSEGLKIYEQLEEELTAIAADLQSQHGMTLAGLEDELEAEPRDSDGKLLSEAQLAEIKHPLRRIERDVLLSVIDQRWIDYLHQLDHLREGIGLRAYGQKDPLIEYKSEAFSMFQNLTYQIQFDTVLMLFNTRIELQMQDQFEHQEIVEGEAVEVHETPLTQAAEQFAQTQE